MFSLFGGKGRKLKSGPKRRFTKRAKGRSQKTKHVSCKKGFGINPKTGRCVKLAGFGPSYYGPCKIGYAINPATGRCHKVASALSIY